MHTALEDRMTELRRLSERLATLTGGAQSPAGTVRAVCRYGRGVSELVVTPQAAEVEGERLPAVIQDTINAAVADVNERAALLLDELRTGAREITEALAGPAADSGSATEPNRLREVWAAYREVVEAALDVLDTGSATLERSS